MLRCRNIVSAQYALKSMCQRGGREITVQRGSFENEDYVKRVQITPIFVCIKNPLDFRFLPSGVPFGVIERYFTDYIMSPVHPPNEEYSYGSRAHHQILPVFEMLRKTPETNQAKITIESPEDIKLKNPPCLQAVQFVVVSGRLCMITTWRSNDLSEAFLINQGGLSLLLKSAAEYAELPVGFSYYFCGGPHIYKYL